MEPVRALIDEGWDIASVFVQWGKGFPFGLQREKCLLVWCVDECAYSEDAGKAGRGYTEVTMRHD